MIIIIDDYCPFVDNRSFLTNELLELSDCDKTIIVYPLSIPEGIDASRIAAPSNVYIRDCAYKKRNKIFLLGMMFRGIFTRQFLSDLKLMGFKGVNISKIKYALLYSTQAYIFFRRIYKDLKKNFMNNHENFIIYAFWMHLNACIGVDLKNKISNSILVTRAHRYDLYEEGTIDGFLPGRKEIFDKADLICPVSQQGVSYLVEKYNYLDPEKIKCFYLGTRDYGIANVGTKKKLISCSYLVPVKRVELIIEALSLIKDMELEWVHYGDGAEREKLEELALTKLPDNIHHRFAGLYQNRDLMEEIKKNDYSYLINVSESEGLPVSMMECMSLGIPVIATNVGGVNEIVNANNGFLMDKDVSPSMLKTYIAKAFSLTDKEYNYMRQEARKTWEMKFNAHKNYMDFYSLIFKLSNK